MLQGGCGAPGPGLDGLGGDGGGGGPAPQLQVQYSTEYSTVQPLNSRVSLSCRAEARPPPSVRWTKDGIPIEEEVTRSLANTYRVRIELGTKAIRVGSFNQEQTLVGAFSVIMNLWMELFQALM